MQAVAKQATRLPSCRSRAPAVVLSRAGNEQGACNSAVLEQPRNQRGHQLRTSAGLQDWNELTPSVAASSFDGGATSTGPYVALYSGASDAGNGGSASTPASSSSSALESRRRSNAEASSSGANGLGVPKAPAVPRAARSLPQNARTTTTSNGRAPGQVQALSTGSSSNGSSRVLTQFSSSSFQDYIQVDDLMSLDPQEELAVALANQATSVTANGVTANGVTAVPEVNGYAIELACTTHQASQPAPVNGVEQAAAAAASPAATSASLAKPAASYAKPAAGRAQRATPARPKASQLTPPRRRRRHQGPAMQLGDVLGSLETLLTAPPAVLLSQPSQPASPAGSTSTVSKAASAAAAAARAPSRSADQADARRRAAKLLPPAKPVMRQQLLASIASAGSAAALQDILHSWGPRLELVHVIRMMHRLGSLQQKALGLAQKSSDPLAAGGSTSAAGVQGSGDAGSSSSGQQGWQSGARAGQLPPRAVEQAQRVAAVLTHDSLQLWASLIDKAVFMAPSAKAAEAVHLLHALCQLQSVTEELITAQRTVSVARARAAPSAQHGPAASLSHPQPSQQQQQELQALPQLPAAPAQVHKTGREEVVACLLPHIQSRLRGAPAHQLTIILKHLATLEHPVPQAWMDSYYEATRPMLATYNLPQLLTTFQALGHMRAAPSQGWLSSLYAAAQPQFAGASVPALCMLAHGAARMPARPGPAWLGELVHVCQERMDLFDAPAYALVLHALGVMNHKPARSWMEEFYDSSLSLLHDFSMQELSLLLRGAAYLQLPPNDEWAAALWAESEARLRYATGAQVASIGWAAVSVLRLRPPRNWATAWVSALARNTRKRRALQQHHARMAAGALAALGMSDRELEQWCGRLGVPARTARGGARDRAGEEAGSTDGSSVSNGSAAAAAAGEGEAAGQQWLAHGGDDGASSSSSPSSPNRGRLFQQQAEAGSRWNDDGDAQSSDGARTSSNGSSNGSNGSSGAPALLRSNSVGNNLVPRPQLLQQQQPGHERAHHLREAVPVVQRSYSDDEGGSHSDYGAAPW
mmetsp:Transcript_37636/g.95065  ORF Transcript_37636/g.95065 Transcript_37636/m.95065 type:complete len:1044 (-) Transcript_37636:854-3985(-)